MTLDRTDAFRRVVEQVLDGVRGQTRLDRQGRCVHLLADPVFREGAVSGAVLVLLDVTEREQGERMRREFTANVSHELRSTGSRQCWRRWCITCATTRSNTTVREGAWH